MRSRFESIRKGTRKQTAEAEEDEEEEMIALRANMFEHSIITIFLFYFRVQKNNDECSVILRNVQSA